MSERISIGNNDVAIRTLLAEAAGEGERGMLASAAVAVNRAKQTGMSLSEIFTQRGQFEPHMNEAGRSRMARFRPGTSQWATAERAINRALAGEDPTNGADHFWSPEAQAAAGRQPPAWGRTGGTMIGRHSFHKIGYRNRDRRFYGPTEGNPVEAMAPVAPAAPPQTAGDLLLGGGRGGTLTGDEILTGSQPVPRERTAPVSAKSTFATMLQQRTAPMDNRTENTGSARTQIEQSFLTNAPVDQNAQRFDNPMDAVANSVYLNSWTGEAARSIKNYLDGNEPGKWDPDFDYAANMEELEAGLSIREVDQLRRESRNLEDAQFMVSEFADRRTRQEVAGTGIATNLVGGLLDPLGAVAGLGVGKAFQGIGIGSRVLAMQGNRAAAVGSMAAEGAIGNVAVTAAMDATGMYATVEDYTASALFGAAMGAALSPLVLVGSPRGGAEPVADAARDALATSRLEKLDEAVVRAGPLATPEQIAKAAEQVEAEVAAAPIVNTHNPIPVQNRVLVPDWTVAPADAPQINSWLDGVADDTARGIQAIAIDRLTKIDASTPTILPSDALEGTWRATGLSTTGLTLLRSAFAPARGLAKVLAEGASGHGGRRHSAALEVVQRETEFNRMLMPQNGMFDLWRKSKGISAWDAHWNDKGRAEFNEAISVELRRRDPLVPNKSVAATSDPYVKQAADNYAAFYKAVGDEQIKWGTVGSQNITSGQEWYFPQLVSAEKIKRMGGNSPELLNQYRAIIAQQAEQIFGWDKKFAEFFGRRYIKTAQDRANGGYDSPANLAHAQAGDFVQDLLVNMRAGASADQMIDIGKVEASFARGGASFTKGRLDFDVMHQYDDGKGGKIRLLDIMESDHAKLARGYGRRAAGEIALTKVGIPGKHGIDMVRGVMEAGANKGLVTPAELKAFDQLLGEITNTPVGGARVSAAAENLRLITSAIKLGGMGFTQFAESANAFAALGVQATMGSLKAVPRLVKEVRTVADGGKSTNPILRTFEETQGYEFGLETYANERTLQVPDPGVQMYATENLGLITKAARTASHYSAILSGQRIITAVQTRGMAEQIVRKVMLDVKKGTQNTKVLEDMGINPALQKALFDNMEKIAVFKGKGLVSVDLRAGNLSPAQVAEITGAINRGASQIIQRVYPGETGAWAHDDYLKLLFQFRTFSLTAVEKQWGRNIKTHGHVKAMVTLIGAMSFAAPIHLARVNLRVIGMSEADREEYLEKNTSIAALTQATLNYASSSGLLGDIWDLGGGTVSNVADSLGVDLPDWVSATVNPRGGGTNDQLLGGKIAPSLGVVQDLYELTQGKWDRVRSLLPGQSLPYMVPPLNVIEDALTPEEE